MAAAWRIRMAKKKKPQPKTRQTRRSEIKDNPASLERKAQTAAAPSKGPAARPNSIVGVGASAGGLEAFEQLLAALPEDTGMSFVLVQHLAPKHESILSELLSKATRMPVSEVSEGV